MKQKILKRIVMFTAALSLCMLMLCSCMATSGSGQEAAPPAGGEFSPSSSQTDGSSSATERTDAQNSAGSASETRPDDSSGVSDSQNASGSQSASGAQDYPDAQTGTKPAKPPIPDREEITSKYDDMTPTLWGERMDGIVSRLDTKDKAVALTLDACGWGKGSGYDEKLIAFLVEKNIPATLFISGKWIEDNPGEIDYLAQQENFEIENHGYAHKPLSVNGQSVYGIDGTASPAEVYDEIVDNALRIEELTGRRPLFFRTGTAYYDDVAVKIAGELGVKIAGFTISGDGGAGFSAEQIKQVCDAPENGAILLFHMNHPESDTFKGVKAVYKNLKAKGYTFVKMEDY